MQELTVNLSGIQPLLMNNPRMVDYFDFYAEEKRKLTSKRAKTESDHLEIRRIEVEAKTYHNDTLGVYVPSNWLISAICKHSFTQAKISKAKIRGAVFANEQELKLKYKNSSRVDSLASISSDKYFQTTLLLPQQSVRLAKCFPIFHDWAFSATLLFDESIIDLESLKDLIGYAAKYGGFGDFRPTYGRATVEFS